MGDRLKDKIAIVTGAGSVGSGWGNGKAAAVLFAREGAKVLAVDINPTAAEETRRIILEEGGECATHRTDVSRAEQVKAMVDRCLEVYGRIDVLHNNVGILQVGGPEEISEQQWDHLFAVNVKGMFLSCKYVLPAMERQGKGSIVNISSIAAIRYTGFPAISYHASKGAVNQLTQSIALQYAPKNIRANCILPGFMNTPMIVEPLKKFLWAGRRGADGPETGRHGPHGQDGRGLGCGLCGTVPGLGRGQIYYRDPVDGGRWGHLQGELSRIHQGEGQKEIHEGDPRSARREKELSTKLHEGRRRATKGLEKPPEGSAQGREGEKASTKGAKVSVKGAFCKIRQ